MTDTKIIKRFMEKVEICPETGCWLWTSTKYHNGYGQFWVGRPDCRQARAHRFAYEHWRGPIPDGLQIDHLCRVRHCVNPEHLEAVTASENTKRGRAGDRLAKAMKAKTHCPRGHPYSGDNLLLLPKGYRECRTCRRAGDRARYRRAMQLRAKEKAGMKAFKAEVHLDLREDAGHEDVRRFLESAVQNYINLRQPSPDKVKPDPTGVVVSNVRRTW